MVVTHEYLVAWTIYVVAGIGCSVVWWKITSHIKSAVWRDILRGLAIVAIFTPWYAGDTPEFYAPAIVVLLMDVLLSGTESGMKGGVVLLLATFLMLLVLTIRQFRRGRKG